MASDMNRNVTQMFNLTNFRVVGQLLQTCELQQDMPFKNQIALRITQWPPNQPKQTSYNRKSRNGKRLQSKDTHKHSSTSAFAMLRARA